MSGRWAQRARAAAARVLGGEPDALTVAALRVREGREVYLCSAGERAVVAKCYPDAERAAAAARALELLGGAHGPLLVPECLALDAGERVVVQTHLRGRPLGERLAAGAGDEAVRRLAAAVGALHGLGVRLPAEVSRATTLAAAEDALRRLSGADARLAARGVAGAREAFDGAPPLGPVPSHGDLGVAQILDCPPHLAIVDFDKAAQAEPALDVGNLVAQLVRSRPGDGAALAAALVAGYEAAAGATVAPLAAAYALLVLARKLAWLAPGRRAPVRAALEALVSSPLAPLAPR